jgi:hypothetical protein
MADLALTADYVRVTKEDCCEIHKGLASSAITVGQPVYIVTATGKYAPADANGSAPLNTVRGIALNTAAANGAVDVLVRGFLYGFTLTGVDYGAQVFVSDTAGSLADAAGTASLPVGRCVGIAEANGTLVKVLYVNINL